MKKLKFKLKLLVTALAIAGAGNAMATIADESSTVGGELFLAVFNQATNQSYVRDLGITFASFVPTATSVPLGSTNGGTVSWSAGAGATPTNSAGSVNAAGYGLSFAADPLLLSSFVSLAGATYQVIASRGGTTAYGALTTSNNASTDIGSTTNTQLSVFKNIWSSGAVPSMNTQGTMPDNGSPVGSVNGSMFTNDPNNAGNVGKILQNNFAGKATTFQTDAAVGTALNFYFLGKNGTGLTSPVALTTFAGQWLLDGNGALSYSVAAVPEPGTWALFAAGLIGVGAIARRRTAA